MEHMQEEYKQSQNFKINKLTDSEFNTLTVLFSKAKPGNPVSRGNYELNEARTLITEDNKLKDFLKNITGIDNEVLSLHYVTYNEGGRSLPHKDTNTSNTIIFLLENCEEGGKLLVNQSDKWETVPLNEPGQWFNFKGSQNIHKVSEVKKGKRKVLVVWYEKNRNLL
jgi:hypothetical protein